MVKEVIGKADGIELVFLQNAEGLWETTVPADADGMYILELYAIDYAGNSTYMTKILLAYDATALCWHMVPLEKYEARKTANEYTAEEQPTYSISIGYLNFDINVTMDRYTPREVYPCHRGGRYG